MSWSNRDRICYYLLLVGGVGVMMLAFALSFMLKLPSNQRYAVVAVIGLAGYGISNLAKNFKRPG